MSYLETYSIQRNGYEARQTSKEKIKMPRIMLAGPRPCTSFCFVLVYHE